MEIKSLANIDFNTIFNGFSRAFADYEMQLNRVQLEAMLKRRGFNPDISFAAFEGDQIIAFTLNGTGYFNGIPTAYDTGTGTLKEYRGQGLATKIFEYSIPYLKENHIRQYLLEVLQHNTKAISVYRNLGFEVSREFNYFRQKNEEIRNYSITDFVCTIESIEIKETDSIAGFWDFYPSWQNSFESIGRSAEEFVTLGAFTGNKLIGYAVFEPTSGDITQIAVDKQYRRKGVASLLLKEMAGINKNDSVKVINTDLACASITQFLQAKKYRAKRKTI